jgi:hypothetical protein
LQSRSYQLLLTAPCRKSVVLLVMRGVNDCAAVRKGSEMAEVTELAELPAAAGKKGRVDWDQVLDGRVWKLVCGTDFDNEDGKTVRSTARREAKSRLLEVETRPPVKEGRHVVVYVQAKRELTAGAGSASHDSRRLEQ